MSLEQEKRITITDLWHAIIKSRKIIIFFSLITASITFVWCISQSAMYQASATLVLAEKERSGHSVTGSSGLLGVASGLVGLDLSSGLQTDKGIAIFMSRRLAERNIDELGLSRQLFADRWDEVEQKWKPAGPFRKMKWKIFKMIGLTDSEFHATQKPTRLQVVREFLSRVSMVENRKTGIVTLSVNWEDPEVAAKIANTLVKNGNDFMREKRRREADQKIAYLSNEMKYTENSKISAFLSSLIETELSIKMRANTERDYAFEIIDAAVPENEPYSPRTGTLTIIAALFGACLGIVFSFLRLVLQIA